MTLTRFTSNLRPTTHECVHLITRGHFGHVSDYVSDENGGHTIRSAENNMLHTNSPVHVF